MKKPTIHIICLSFLLSVSIASGCAHQTDSTASYTRDGETYGQVRGTFRHKWWNYYERGLSFADGQFFKEAVKDFNAAIRKREKDQRMARTYGMHFMDYFPHRELGIVQYQTGNLEAAKRGIITFSPPVSHFEGQILSGSCQKGSDGKERRSGGASPSYHQFLRR